MYCACFLEPSLRVISTRCSRSMSSADLDLVALDVGDDLGGLDPLGLHRSTTRPGPPASRTRTSRAIQTIGPRKISLHRCCGAQGAPPSCLDDGSDERPGGAICAGDSARYPGRGRALRPRAGPVRSRRSRAGCVLRCRRAGPGSRRRAGCGSARRSRGRSRRRTRWGCRTDVAHVDVDLRGVGLAQQGEDLDRRRAARPQVAQQPRQREPGVDDVLDDQDVPAGDVAVEVLEDAHDARRTWCPSRRTRRPSSPSAPGTCRARARSAMTMTAPLSTPTSSRSRPRSRRRSGRQLGDAGLDLLLGHEDLLEVGAQVLSVHAGVSWRSDPSDRAPGLGRGAACHSPGRPDTPPGRATGPCPRQATTRASSGADVPGGERPGRAPGSDGGPAEHAGCGRPPGDRDRLHVHGDLERLPRRPCGRRLDARRPGVEGVGVGPEQVGGAGQRRRHPGAEGVLEQRAAPSCRTRTRVNAGSSLCGSSQGCSRVGDRGRVAAPPRGTGEERPAVPSADRRASRTGSARPSPGPGRAGRSRPGRRGCARAAPRPHPAGRPPRRAPPYGRDGRRPPGRPPGPDRDGRDLDGVEPERLEHARDRARATRGPGLQPVVDGDRRRPANRVRGCAASRRSGQGERVGTAAAGDEHHGRRARQVGQRPANRAPAVASEGRRRAAHRRRVHPRHPRGRVADLAGLREVLRLGPRPG